MTEPNDTLTEKVIGLAMKVHSSLGPGFVEFVYRNALIHELRKGGIKAEIERPLKVVYDGAVVGDFKADLFLDEWLLCELKAVRSLLPEHEVQLVNYLAALNLDFGLLLNFGGYSLDVKRKYLRNGYGETGFKKRKAEGLVSNL